MIPVKVKRNKHSGDHAPPGRKLMSYSVVSRDRPPLATLAAHLQQRNWDPKQHDSRTGQDHRTEVPLASSRFSVGIAGKSAGLANLRGKATACPLARRPSGKRKPSITTATAVPSKNWLSLATWTFPLEIRSVPSGVPGYPRTATLSGMRSNPPSASERYFFRIPRA